MNNTIEEAFNTIFADMDSAPKTSQAEYGDWADGYDACSTGLPCPTNASVLFLRGYGCCYEEGAKADHGY